MTTRTASQARWRCVPFTHDYRWEPVRSWIHLEVVHGAGKTCAKCGKWKLGFFL